MFGEIFEFLVDTAEYEVIKEEYMDANSLIFDQIGCCS